MNRVNESPAVANASRLVRFDTGSSSDAVLARCAVAYACGRAGTRSVRAVASTTGVSSTTVASRLKHRRGGRGDDEHLTQQRDRTPANCRAPSPRRPRRNRPSSSQSLASTSTAARKPTTGSSRLASCAGVVQRDRADRNQNGRRGHVRPRPPASPRGRAIAKTSTTTSSASDRISVEAQAQGSSRRHTVGRCSVTPSCRGELTQHAHATRPGRLPHKARRATALSAAGRSRPSGCSTTGGRRPRAPSRSSSRRGIAAAAGPTARRPR